MKLLITRPSGVIPEWLGALDSRIHVESLPLMKFQSMASDYKGSHDLAILTSVETLKHLLSSELIQVKKWYLVGRKTKAALEQKLTEMELPVDRIAGLAKGQSLESLLEEFCDAFSNKTLWYPCSLNTPWGSRSFAEKFGIKVEMDYRYRTEVLYPEIQFANENVAWLYFSGSAVEAAKSQSQPLLEQMKNHLHIAWGKTAEKALKDLPWKSYFLNHLAPESTWIEEIEKILLKKESL